MQILQLHLPMVQNYCCRCAKPLPRGQQACGSCLGELLSNIRTTVLFYYQSPVDQLISNLKFGNNLIGAKILGELLSNHLYAQYQNKNKPEVIIPVPLHIDRLRERGYNQALEISRPIAKKLNIPIDRFGIKRIKNTLPQAKLTVKERESNIKKAFSIADDFYYNHVAVVDDVITTGNTIIALCKILGVMGIKRIDVWCLAKSLLKI